MPQVLPAKANILWLKKTAKQQLAELRVKSPTARLHEAQLALARAYGFASWRALKAHVDGIAATDRESRRVFDAAQAGDVEAVRRAFAAGFDPATPDSDGRTVMQIAKEHGHDAIEILTRTLWERVGRPESEGREVRAILSAAQDGNVAELRAHLDAHPELIDAMGGGLKKATALHLAALRNRHEAIRLLIERGADLDPRDFPDNATPLHFAVVHGDLETIRLLVEAGADVEGKGDDYGIGVLGWATCFARVREDVAEYLLAHGATLTLWSAIALDRVDDVRVMIARRPDLLVARMTRNQHRRTVLHHAAAKNRVRMVRLLLELGADPNAIDAAGATPVTTASLENADAAVIDLLLNAGAKLDFLTAVNLGRYAAAEAMLRDDPARIGPEGRDTIALHLAVNKRNLTAIRWLIAHGVAVSAKRPMWGCNHTALHMTVESGAIDLARLLLDAGADPNVRDDKFKATALGWATYFGRPEIAALIRERGGVE
ncbi:Ankyrin repeat [Enhydrobacter aerosaccus]|uniref:Ankyrin repeat n=1 Tax=Enhydrobacter aerosaccus TaxID=225324 RepID=A0A1T4RM03_9HYPH|nr:ankyrin repeat domain-containing protein [Enhydrobacter aerosaccus]SKA17002.1 Ankyrin repeat [Enhydrobacter aerosaccus]